MRGFVGGSRAWAYAGMAVVDAVITLLVLLGVASRLAGRDATDPAWAVGAVTVPVLVAAVWMRRRWPVPVAVVGLAALVVHGLVLPVDVPPDQWERALSVGPRGNGDLLVLLCALTVPVTLRLRWRSSRWWLAAALAATAVPGVVGVPPAVEPDVTQHAMGAVLVVATYAAAMALRQRRLAVAEVARAAEEAARRAVEMERARDAEARAAVAEERLRIARELHDVVAHHVSLITVQAAAAATVLESDAADRVDIARQAIATVQDSAAAAIDEMRTVVRALRERGGPSRPAGLCVLPELLAGFREAGLEVDETETGTRVELPAIVDLAAYRIVQESLTNVLRHADVRRAELTIAWEASALVVRVRDDGTLSAPYASGSGGGHGLRGMQERAAAVGGQFRAGPGRRGGFEVEAALPYLPLAAAAGGVLAGTGGRP